MRIKPWMVVATLAVVGAVGATVVYNLGKGVQRRDRADIQAWTTRALPLVAEVKAARAELGAFAEGLQPQGEVPPELQRLRATLQRVRGELEDVPRAEILTGTAGPYLTASVQLLRAVAAVEDIALLPRGRAPTAAQRSAVATALKRTDEELAAGDDALANLYCRARLPECAR